MLLHGDRGEPPPDPHTNHPVCWSAQGGFPKESKEMILGDDILKFQSDLIQTLGFDGGRVHEDYLQSFLKKYFDKRPACGLRSVISADLRFFRENDPASANYDEMEILSVRRAMAAITAHRFFQEILQKCRDMLYEIEVIAKSVQKDTNVEIHPSAKIGVPFAIDHGHGTVIGATTQIGNRVFIYHGGTFGASGRRSKAQRRHPKIGDNVFFGNGSQVLGPSILGDGVQIGSGAIVRDSYLHTGAKIAMEVRVAGAVIPGGVRVFGQHPESLRRYWVQLDGDDESRWVEFDDFNAQEFE